MIIIIITIVIIIIIIIIILLLLVLLPLETKLLLELAEAHLSYLKQLQTTLGLCTLLFICITVNTFRCRRKRKIGSKHFRAVMHHVTVFQMVLSSADFASELG